MSQEELNDELADIEAALATVGPGPSRLQRDRVMYLAGRASVGPATQRTGTAWAWPAAFGAMTVVAATLLVMVVAQPQAHMADHTERAVESQPLAADGVTPSEDLDGSMDEGSKRDPLDDPYLRELGRVVALGPDPWASNDPSPAIQRHAVPLKPYPQLLESLLKHPQIRVLPSDSSTRESDRQPGVES